jgi:methionine-R-sulfoxide reductase
MPDMRARAGSRPASLPGQAEITPLVKDEKQWEEKLTDEQFYILRQKGTERAFTGKYWRTKPVAEQRQDMSVYECAGCGQELFRADSKFDSGCGWPSFDRMIKLGTVKEIEDTSNGWLRTEVVCAKCGGHLGHLFDDGPTDTGLRYCINSVSIVRREVKGEGSPSSAGEKR